MTFSNFWNSVKSEFNSSLITFIEFLSNNRDKIFAYMLSFNSTIILFKFVNFPKKASEGIFLENYLRFNSKLVIPIKLELFSMDEIGLIFNRHKVTFLKKHSCHSNTGAL